MDFEPSAVERFALGGGQGRVISRVCRVEHNVAGDGHDYRLSKI